VALRPQARLRGRDGERAGLLELLDIELHPGLIVFREGGLTRAEQWDRLEAALDHVQGQPDPAAYMVNRVIEVLAAGEVVVHELPLP
jgi:hypothetical protein